MLDQKLEVTISVSGPGASGKSAIIQLIAHKLAEYEIELIVNDTDPPRTPYALLTVLTNLRRKTKVIIDVVRS